MSRSALNVHLSELERLGLISRRTLVNEKTNMQRPTAYSLPGFKEWNRPGDQAKPVSGNRTQPVSGNRTQNLCPEKAKSRVQNPDTNLGNKSGNHTRARDTPKSKPDAQLGKINFSAKDRVKFRKLIAEKLVNGIHVAPSAVTPSLAREMLEHGEVEEHHLKGASIAF